MYVKSEKEIKITGITIENMTFEEADALKRVLGSTTTDDCLNAGCSKQQDELLTDLYNTLEKQLRDWKGE